MIMSSENVDGDVSLRRSKRNQKMKPEYEPFEDPEQTLKKGTPKTLKKQGGAAGVESYFNYNSERKKDSILDGHVERPYVNGFQLLQNQTDGKTELCDRSVENLCRATTKKKNFSQESGTLPGVRSIQQTRPSISKQILIAVLLLASLYVLRSMFSEEDTSENLKSLFPQQSDRLWGFVSHGMYDTNPFVLLLVHSGQAELANCLGRHIAEKVVWGRTKQTTDPIILDGRNDHSNLLLTLKPQIEKHHALLLQNIENLEGDVADKLHFILDTHDPWIPGGVYVLTLHVPNINDDVRESFIAVRTFLKNKWLLKDDVLDPLVARICNFEYVVKKDSNPCK